MSDSPALQAAIDRHWNPMIYKRRMGVSAFRLGWEAAHKGYSKETCPYKLYTSNSRMAFSPGPYRAWMAGFDAGLQDMRLEGKLEYIQITRVVADDHLEIVTTCEAVQGTFNRIQFECPTMIGQNSSAVPGELWIDLVDSEGDLLGDPIIIQPQWIVDFMLWMTAPKDIIEKAMGMAHAVTS